MPAISIIIPVYNAADTLERCVSSVLSQRFDDWELLLVDDGSLDDSLQVCSRLRDNDPRIKLLTKKHEGVSSARNLALEQISGQHVCFIDADDFIEPDYLSSFYRHREYDTVLCGYYVDNINESGELIRHQEYRPDNIEIASIDDRSLLAPLFMKGMIHVNCNKLLNAAILKNHQLRYPDIPINEDYVFMVKYLEHSHSIKTIQHPLYHWVRVKGKHSALSGFSVNQIKLYNDAHLLTSHYFNNQLLAGQIMYYSYYWLVLKSVKETSPGPFHVNDLAALMENPLLKESFRVHQPSSLGEKALLFLLTHKRYRLFCLLNRKSKNGQ